MTRLLVPLLALVLLLGVVIGLDRSPPRADFVFINASDINTLDPQRMSWMQDLRATRILFEGLVQTDIFSWGFDVQPGVAERWEIRRVEEPLVNAMGGPVLDENGEQLTATREVYTFFLRDNAKWSNGSPVTAGDFVYAWRRGMLPDTASPYLKFFELVRGAAQFHQLRQAMLNEYQARPRAQRNRAEAEALFRETVDAFEHGMSGEAARARFTDPERRARLGLDDESAPWLLDNGVGIRAIDERTLEIAVYRPTPYFLDICAFGTMYPVYEPVVSRFEEPNPDTGSLVILGAWTKPEHIVSNGPFELTLWRFRRDMRFEQNPHYWNREALKIRSIEIPSIEDSNAQVLAFQTGRLDWMSNVEVAYRGAMWEAKKAYYEKHKELVEELRAKGYDQFEIDRHLPPDPRLHIHVIPAFGSYFYNFNCSDTLPDGRDNPFRDARVRRAFSMTIDRKAIVRDVRRIDERKAHSLTPPGSVAGYEPPRGLPSICDATNPEERRAIADEARSLLIEAMRDMGMGSDPSRFPTVELLFNQEGGHDLIAQVVASSWETYLGVSTRLVSKDLQVFRDDLKKQNFMTARAGWYGDYGDPSTFLGINRTGDGNNDRNYSNPEYDALLGQAAVEADPVRRMELLHEAERIIMEDDLPMAPVFHYSNVYMFDPHRLSGITSHPRSVQNPHMAEVFEEPIGPGVARALPPRPTTPPSEHGADNGDAEASDSPSPEAGR